MKRWIPIVGLLLILPVPSWTAEPEEQLAQQLVEVVRDANASVWVRIEAAKTLGKLGYAGGAAVPGLASQLRRFGKNEFPALQEEIVRALGEIGHPALPALPSLTRASGQNIDIDRAVSQSITRIINASDEYDVPALIIQLRSRDESIRLRAVKVLTRLGGVARPAVPALLRSLTDPDRDVRHAAVTALAAILPGQRPPELVFRVFALDLQDPDESIRLRAAKVLGKFGPQAYSAVPALEAALDDPDRDVRRAIIDAISRITPP